MSSENNHDEETKLNEMKTNGTLDYYLDLTSYINQFITRNYPLSQEDFKSILEDKPTEHVQQRQQANEVLHRAMKEALDKIAAKNADTIDPSVENIQDVIKLLNSDTSDSMQSYKEELNNIIQYMLKKLWESQHQQVEQHTQEEINSEEVQTQPNSSTTTNNPQLLDETIQYSYEVRCNIRRNI